MITFYICLLSITCVTIAVSLEVTVKGDPCSKFDNCFTKPFVRTCSCAKDCQAYGTCCHEVFHHKQGPGGTFSCYHRRVVTPVFVKRSCSDDFRGHLGVERACIDDEEDEMDVKNNVLVSSHKTKTTYWNTHCAICNNEASEDFQFWNIEVYCPQHTDVDGSFIRKNLTFDQDIGQWGLKIEDKFLQCVVKYAPSPYIPEVKHCTPNLNSGCPSNYKDADIVTKCSQYYAERKLKNSEIYYKNVHCAMCNGVDMKELECPGMAKPEDNAEESEFREMVEESFTFKEFSWLVGNTYKCSRGYAYDPTRKMCRRYEERNTTITTADFNSASVFGSGYLAVLALLFSFLY